MDRATISRIEEWEARPISGGYVGLNELADDGFTGAVAAAGTYLFMLNGRIVGVAEGPLSAFEGADATAYSAPDPALPLLFAMRDEGGEVRGSYYTDDTPIREVDETLTEGGFTGYLELSENVLSGDYYVVYYGGRSLAAAFVGNKGRVVTGDEALQLAADEVGIYEVTAVDLDVTDVPEPPGGSAAAAVAPDATGETPEEDGEEETGDPAAGEETEEEDRGEAVPEDDVEPAEDVAVDEEPTPTEPADVGEAPDEATPGPDIPDAEAEADAGGTGAGPAPDAAPEPEEEGRPEPADEPAETGAVTDATDAREDADEPSGRPASPKEPQPSEPDERFEEEARWREARTVPALDPDESEDPAEERPGEERRPEEPREVASPEAGGTTGPGEDDARIRDLEGRLDHLESELEATERERRRLEERLEEVSGEREDLIEERDALAERVERLESRLEEAEAAAATGGGSGATPAGGSGGGQRVDPETALDQTDLFVRYGSKSKPTLTTAHDGQASAEDVAENLRIDSHSRFDSGTATVDGRPFSEFLEGTIQYRFVSWLVEVLLYEIRDTGTETGLRALYDVLPEIDRAEFNGTVTATDEGGDEHARSFDVVCRDRMGKPLVVANINDSLDPATGDMMATLVEDGTEVAEAHESIGAAFLVTASFFQPDALESAADATRGGGFLSRDSKKSFVKLSRSGGYHLCLVEARGDDFHVAVPEF